ncbi:hypothetical protein AC579_6049 [Pseudocercospora musae]|uniref:Uncharacterized protein n=1 Tax=Pseudocercospora musae TaxID=113226 RepID=A0A139HU52_9PEZI|nr:hypothetical protein AC579_6049 [Pseudocercospora musae]
MRSEVRHELLRATVVQMLLRLAAPISEQVGLHIASLLHAAANGSDTATFSCLRLAPQFSHCDSCQHASLHRSSIITLNSNPLPRDLLLLVVLSQNTQHIDMTSAPERPKPTLTLLRGGPVLYTMLLADAHRDLEPRLSHSYHLTYTLLVVFNFCRRREPALTKRPKAFDQHRFVIVDGAPVGRLLLEMFMPHDSFRAPAYMDLAKEMRSGLSFPYHRSRYQYGYGTTADDDVAVDECSALLNIAKCSAWLNAIDSGAAVETYVA